MNDVVGVAQLVEHRFVVPRVVGSSPIIHPTQERGPIAQLVERRTLNPSVPGSSPGGPTIFNTHCPRAVGVLALGWIGSAKPWQTPDSIAELAQLQASGYACGPALGYFRRKHFNVVFARVAELVDVLVLGTSG